MAAIFKEQLVSIKSYHPQCSHNNRILIHPLFSEVVDNFWIGEIRGTGISTELRKDLRLPKQ